MIEGAALLARVMAQPAPLCSRLLISRPKAWVRRSPPLARTRVLVSKGQIPGFVAYHSGHPKQAT